MKLLVVSAQRPTETYPQANWNLLAYYNKKDKISC